MDPETTVAFGQMIDRIEAKITAADVASSARNDTLHNQIHTNQQTIQGELHTLALKVGNIGTRFATHEKSDEKDFKEIRDELKDSGTERLSLWKLLATGGGSAGFFVGLMELLKWKSGG